MTKKTKFKSFREYVSHLNKKAFDKPPRVSVSRSTVQLPHTPGSLSKGVSKSVSGTNNERAQEAPTTGEVVGKDAATGEALVRQPGNRVVRAQVSNAAVGNTVSVTARDRDAKIQSIRRDGVVTSSKVVSNTGWKPVSGSTSKQRLSITTSTVIEGLDLLGDPCTPPDVKLKIVRAANANHVYINSDGSVGGVLAPVLIGRRSSFNDDLINGNGQFIKQLYAESKAAGKQGQTLPQVISLDSLGGTSTVGETFSPTQASLWECVDNECIQTPNGFYATKAQCEQNCGPRTFNCVNGTCVEVQGGTGKFSTLADCIASNCGTRYTCVDGTPVPTPNGEFATLEAAIQGGCYWGYSCDGEGGCTPEIGGQFKSLACCQQNCVDTSIGGIITLRGPSVDVISEYDTMVIESTGPMPINIDLRPLDEEGNPTNNTNIAPVKASAWAVVPDMREGVTLTLENTVLTYGTGLQVFTTDAEVDAFLKNSKYVEYVMQVSRQAGPIAGGLIFPGLNTDFKTDLNSPQSSMTLQGVLTRLNSLIVPSNLSGSVTHSPRIPPTQFNAVGWFANDTNVPLTDNALYLPECRFNPTTNFTKYSSWSYNSDGYLEVVYPTVVWQEQITRIPNYPYSVWESASFVLYHDEISKPPGCFPGKLYQTGNGRAFTNQHQWGVNFRAYYLNLGSPNFFNPTNTGVAPPPDFVASPLPNQQSPLPTTIKTVVNVTPGNFTPPSSIWQQEGKSAGAEPVLGDVDSFRAFLDDPDWSSYYASVEQAGDAPGNDTCTEVS